MNFSQDSQSQYMEPGQKRQKATLEDLDMEKKEFLLPTNLQKQYFE